VSAVEWTITLRRLDGREQTIPAMGTLEPMSRIPWADSGEGQVGKFMQFGKKRDAPRIVYFDLVEHDKFRRTAIYAESET
jgi:hypothetical protein